MDEISKLKTMKEAIAYAKPVMKDTYNEFDTGTLLFGAWALRHMKWSDVFVRKDETSLALVMKDSDGARGKRLCWSGSIIEISVMKTRFGTGSEGLLMTNAEKLIRFIAAGSSGELVERSPARICGVVIGRYSYPNSGGGTGHAVMLVGMFSLPENKRK